jgi:isopentenyl diphosphate isomerase/L-lactate dehydrogenase-like FMN-dependent dehydrogenase
VWHGRAWSWEKMPWLMEQWGEISGGKPFCLKGIQSVDDAKKAVELGVDGIVVSNHAGRQVDGAIASLDALEKIVAGMLLDLPSTRSWINANWNIAVGDKTYIMFDSGVRGASDIFKALALGAKFVFVGKLWVWGLSVKGELGVRHVMKSLLADFDILMNISGYQSVDQITRESIDSLPNTAGMIAEKSRL